MTSPDEVIFQTGPNGHGPKDDRDLVANKRHRQSRGGKKSAELPTSMNPALNDWGIDESKV
jgi:hypothetical protein